MPSLYHRRLQKRLQQDMIRSAEAARKSSLRAEKKQKTEAARAKREADPEYQAKGFVRNLLSRAKKRAEDQQGSSAFEGEARLWAAVAAALRPPRSMLVSEWADKYRMLSPEASAEPGPWQTERVPYLRGFMDACCDGRIETVIGLFASQTGKTESILNIIGRAIDQDPGPALLVQPTIELAADWGVDRFNTMVRDTACLAQKVQEVTHNSQGGGSTKKHKKFPGGYLALAGSNSPGTLSGRPIRYLFCDEIDRYVATSEGDPLDIAIKRTTTFWNRKHIFITSPGNWSTAPSVSYWERSDQRYYLVPCPECGEKQRLQWSGVRWEKSADGEALPHTARYRCANRECGALWDDATRWGTLSKGEWVATKPFSSIAGFHLNALYAPWTSVTLEELVKEFLACRGNHEKLRVFTNTRLAEWWKESTEEVDIHSLAARRETYSVPTGTVLPMPVIVLTAGVDVQQDRIEYEVVGWGEGDESWSVEYGILMGDAKKHPGVLNELFDQRLSQAYLHATGVPLYLRGLCIDTGGHATQEVYKAVRHRFRRVAPNGVSSFVFGIKGVGVPGKPIWEEEPSQSRKVRGVNLWTLGSLALKDQVMARLQVKTPGPGYCHFPREYPISYFEGLTAEHIVIKYRYGQPYRNYELKHPGAANEALDCRCYAYAALVGLQSPRFRMRMEAERARLAKQASSLDRSLTPGVAVMPLPESQAAPSGGMGASGRSEATGAAPTPRTGVISKGVDL